MALSELQVLFRRCLHGRISAVQFCEILKQYNLRQKVKSRHIVSTYINCCLHFCIDGDPLLSGYLEQILLSYDALVEDILAALLLQWKNLRDSQEQHRIISTQTQILTDLNITLQNNPTLSIDHRKCVVLTARWLTAMAKWSLSDSLKDNVEAHNLTQVLGMLLDLLLVINTSDASEIYTAVQQATDQCMSAFPSISMELMNKLSTLPKPHDDGLMEPHVLDMAAMQFEEGIMQAPVVATRSATTALIQHLLSTGSTIDDSVIYTFLNTRHAGNHAGMFTDLIFASIDAMIKPISNEMYQDQCQLFILNKLPFILAYIVTSSFESFSEQNLIDAWNYLNASDPDSNTGRRFLQICVFHHLIPAESATTLVGEDTSLKGLYAKDDIVAQVTANHARGPRLVDELLRNDGNAGMMSQAIYEVMHNYCHMKELQHLKDMANTIVRKPAAINAIDEWKWDDIHGESQPVYDEFGSVFLLILAFKQRLRLTESELGIQQRGFLARYFSSKNTEQKMTDLTQKHVSDWIKSLYIDEGLSDELTTNCSAQDFYMLVPTLLRNSVTAHSKGKLSHDTLKAGLEYLLEPFLLPSLIPAFGWIEHIASTETKTAQLVMQILVKSPGGEAREIHQTILAMAADRINMDLLPKSQFAIELPKGDLTQIRDEIYISLTEEVRKYGPLHVVEKLVAMLPSDNFHTLLDFVATMVVVSDVSSAVEVLHGKIGQYLKKGENLYAEAVVHLARRVQMYSDTLTPQDLGIESFVPMNVANINLDTVPETFQQQQEQNQDIDQVLNEAAAMSMDQLDNTNLDDMYELQANDFGLGGLDDLDLDMF